MDISVVILSFNSEAVITDTINKALEVSSDVYVVDSFSSDSTVELAKSAGAIIVEHEFLSYDKQRNWAIQNLPLKGDWELHLDSDEILSDELVAEINQLKVNNDEGVSGYHMPRLVKFLGQMIRHGGMYPIWHMRLFRRHKGKCENRNYDQHFIVDGESKKLNNCFIDDHRSSINEWIARHNRWSDAEVVEINSDHAQSDIEPKIGKDPIKNKRALKGFYYQFPLFFRAFLLFIYRYIFRLGFLDGKPGLIYFILQTFWFRFLVDAKVYEQRISLRNSGD